MTMTSDEFLRLARAILATESRIETTMATARALRDEETLASCEDQLRRLDEQARTLVRRWHGIED
jgi:hypothetical protein